MDYTREELAEAKRQIDSLRKRKIRRGTNPS